MSNQVTNSSITAADLKTLEQAGIIPPNTPPAQVAVFAQICKEKGLSPFSKEAHLVGYGGKYSVIIGINGIRKIAAKTKELGGTEDAKFNLTSDGSYFTAAELASGQKKPLTATVTVYRVVGGIRCPFTHTAVFAEFAGSGKWQTMPFQMIAKVAESFALRKGFGDETSGLLIEEELDAVADTQESSPLRHKRNAPSLYSDTGDDAMTANDTEAETTLHGDYIHEIEACRTKDALRSLYEDRKKHILSDLLPAYYAAVTAHAKTLQQ